VTERLATPQEERLLERARNAMAEVERLDELAVGINTLHAEVESALGDAITYAVQAGQALLEAKLIVGHGGWLRWLEENFSATRRTASNYMRLAEYTANGKRVSHLGVGGALKEIAAKSTTQPEIADPEVDSQPEPWVADTERKRAIAENDKEGLRAAARTPYGLESLEDDPRAEARYEQRIKRATAAMDRAEFEDMEERIQTTITCARRLLRDLRRARLERYGDEGSGS
jgi:Protein of unknown function (DUF3102)